MSAVAPLHQRFRAFLEKCGCTVHEEGTATVADDGVTHLHGWNVELRGTAKRELATMADWRHALLAVAEWQENAAE